MIELNLQLFGGGGSGDGLGADHNSGSGKKIKKEEMQLPAPASLFPQKHAEPNGKPQQVNTKKTTESSKAKSAPVEKNVAFFKKNDEYSVHILNHGKESVYIEKISGFRLLASGLRYDKETDTWKDKNGKRLRIRHRR